MLNFIGYLVLWLLGLKAKVEAKRAKVEALSKALDTLLDDMNCSSEMGTKFRKKVRDARIEVKEREIDLLKRLAEDRWLSPVVVELARQTELAKKAKTAGEKCIEVTLAKDKELTERSAIVWGELCTAQSEINLLRKVVYAVRYATHMMSLVSLPFLLGVLRVWFDF